MTAVKPERSYVQAVTEGDAIPPFFFVSFLRDFAFLHNPLLVSGVLFSFLLSLWWSLFKLFNLTLLCICLCMFS